MATDEYGDKTEQPTQRRRSEVREKGIVARSTDLTAAGLLLAACTVVMLLGIPVAISLAQVMHASLSGPAWLRIEPTMIVDQLWSIVKLLAESIASILLLMAVAALAVNFVQVGFLISTDAIKPDIARLNPFAGVKRLFSTQSLVRLGSTIAKLAAIAALATLAVHSCLPAFVPLVAAAPPQILFSIEQSLVKVGFTLAGTLALLAIIDLVFQRWRHEQNLRMTKQEVREEMRSMEGDPALRQRRRDAHRKLARARDLHSVRNADVIITDLRTLAIAIHYDPETMPAPKVIAKGSSEVGQRIRLLATEHGIPVIERQDLARDLDREVKAGSLIPADMYDDFIEIMTYVHQIADAASKRERASAAI